MSCLWLCLSLGLAGCANGWRGAGEYQKGKAAAQADLDKGQILYTIIGMPGPTDPELKKIALEKYAVNVGFHGCVPGPRIDYDRGYKETVVAYLTQKHGFDPVMKIHSELQPKAH